jgi:hypothetical protein
MRPGMSASLPEALRALVSARLAPRNGASDEDVETMAREAIELSQQVDAFRDQLTPADSPEAFQALVGKPLR